MKQLFLIAVAAFTLFAHDDSAARITISNKIAPFGEIRSRVLKLKKGEIVSVFPEAGDAGIPEIDSYIYASRKVLLAKDSDDVVTDKFEWRAPADESVYVIATNAGQKDGIVVIQVRKPSGGRNPLGKPRAAAPQTAIMNVYYATDRERLAKGNEPYGTEPARGDRMEYGLCHVSIPRDHRMGELEGPAIWKLEFTPNPDKHIAFVGPPIPAEEQAFFAHLKDNIAASKDKHVLIYIHGFDTTFTGAARRTAQMAYDLGLNGTAILYSWPSHGSLTPIAYNQDSRNADLTSAHLKTFLVNVGARTGAKKVDIIAHSMGNRVLTRALGEMAIEKSEAHFREIILMAPDVDAALFKQMAARMSGEADKITMYASSRDLALKASMLYEGGYARAGQGGDRIVLVPGIETIDASTADTSMVGAFHLYYADSRTVMSDLFALMQGRAPEERFGLKPADKNGLRYWLFRP